jgi:hypothetical protein
MLAKCSSVINLDFFWKQVSSYTQHNDIRHNDTQHEGTFYYTRHNKTLPLIMLSVIFLVFSFDSWNTECHFAQCRGAHLSVLRQSYERQEKRDRTQNTMMTS